MSANVQTAVFPAAGLGTRMLPATKTFPKELLPLVDRPIIQYGVEEAVNSGIRRVVLVTKPSNTLTRAHFSADPELEAILEERGKIDALAAVRALSVMAEVKTVHQEQPLGLGHAILAAKSEVGDEAFAVVLPDDVIDAATPALQQMTDVFAEVGGPVLLVERVPPDAIQRYGINDATPIRNGVFEIRDLVEKPTPEMAPSNLGIIGRYILTPDLFTALEKTAPSRDGEIQLTDGIAILMQDTSLYAYRFDGVRYDVGNPMGLLKATLELALEREDMGSEVREYIKVLARTLD